MAIIFNRRVKHGKLSFMPGAVYGFEDPDAEPYFKAMGWANDSSDEPAVVITQGEIDIDPATVFGNAEHPRRGQRVLGGGE